METKKESLKVKNKISPDGKITDFIQCESVGGTSEIHRGRNGYEWTGQKGKTLFLLGLKNQQRKYLQKFIIVKNGNKQEREKKLV